MDVKHFAFLARQPSARLQPRERFWGLPKRGIALILANAMFWQPLWAQAGGIVVSGTATGIGAAGNGVPIVNIAAPNTSGLSHNQFQQYNVDSQGVILNNATAQTQSTQLGGIIIGNSQLQGTSATTILNEVVGANRSQLKGYTEVAGQAARVIVANPYGITCDGCGFINTPQATLTTGKPVLEQGQVARYEVQGGDISIEGAGVNAANLDQFDLITRSARLNAELHARKLNVITGRNSVDARSLDATALADDGSTKPALAIDSTALGGMYAGAIRLLGTEQGVGVRLSGEMAASAGDLQIDANGQLTLATTAASGDVRIKAQSVQASQAVHAGNDLRIDSSDELSIKKSLAAAGNITLGSGGLLTNQGAIEAGVNADNSRNASGDVRIQSHNLRNTGSVVAAGNLAVTAGQDVDNRQGVLGARAGTATVSATGRFDNRSGTLQSAGALVVAGIEVLNGAGNLQGTSVTLDAASLDSTQGVIAASAGAARVTTSGRLNNRQGTLQAATELRITGTELLNISGNLLGQSVTLTGVSLDNSQGLIGASSGALTVTSTGAVNNSGGTLQAQTALQVAGSDISNQHGKILAQSINLTGASLNNTQGQISSANGALEVNSSGALDNSAGTMQASTGLTVSAAGLVNDNGRMLGQTVTVTATSLDSHKGVIAASDGALKVTSAGRLDNREGTLQAATELQVSGAEVLNIGGNLLGQSLTLSGSSIDNRAGLIGASLAGVTVTSSGKIDNGQGTILAQTALQARGADIINQGGKLLGQTVTVSAANLNNRSGLIDARGGAATLTSSGWLDNTLGALQAATALSVSGAGLVNQGGTLLGQSVTVTGTTFDNRQQGSVIADQGTLTLTLDQALDNSQGRLQSTAGGLSLSAGELLNRQGVIVGNEVGLTTTQGDIDNQGGQVLGNRLVVDSHAAIDNRAGGQLVSGSDGLKLTAGSLHNQKGTVLAGGSQADIDLGQGALDNNGGNISASAVVLTAGNLDNSQGSLTSLAGNLQLTAARLNNQAGLIEASQTLLLDAQSLDNSAAGRVLAHAGALSRLALQDNLDNRNGRIAIASQALNLQADTLLNSGGQIEHAASGLFSLRSASLQGAQGRLAGLGRGDWTISNVDGTGVWHANDALAISGLQNLTLYAGDRLSSASDLSLQAASLNNAGELLSDGNLTLQVTGALNNQGLISTLQDLSISAASLTQNGGRIASAGDAELTLSGALDNLGRLTAAGNLSVAAERIDNRGTLGAQQQLKLTALRDINNQADSLVFAGDTMTLRADSLVNRYGDFYSQGSLSFAAGDGNRASVLDNLSGSIESASDIDLKVAQLNNSKAEFEPSQKVASRSIVMNCTDCSGSSHSGYYIIRTQYEGSILKDSPASRLLANRDLLVDAVTVINGQSLLAANRNATINAGNFYNRGFTLDNREENINHFFAGSKSGYRRVEAATNDWNTANADLPIEQQTELPTIVTDLPIESATETVRPGNGTTYSGTVQAGNTLVLNVSGELVNGSLSSQGNAQLTGASLDSSASGAGHQQIILAAPVGVAGPMKDVQRIETVAADGSVSVSFVPVDFTGAPFVSVDPTALPGFRLPQGDYGLFIANRNPASPYRIESNPALTDTAKFMSSDYLLGQLGYDLTEASRRLGDGRYETRMIADAVRAQTGQRFLADGLGSDYEQFQYLMDNALASKQALNLSVGVGLTAEQVAALTHDIVWMEERVIDGETVLTPVLYLAKVDARNLRGGSLVQGRDVQMISGGDLKNVGTIRASEDLTAISGGSIFQGGLAQANDTLTLLAQDSIRNAMSGQIRGSTVNLTSLTGDIINDRTAVQFQLGAGSTTQLDAGGSIHAGSQLAINAANDLTSLGQISSDGDASLSAGNDLNLLAVEDRSVSREALRRGMRTEETVTQLGASVSAAGNLSLSAGNDLNAVASKASAGKNLTVSAERDINLLSAADEHNVESTYKKGKKKVEEIDEQMRQVGSEFSAGENLDMDAGRDVTLLASRLKAGEEAYVYAGQNLALLAAQNRDYTLYDMQKKGSFGSKASQRDEVTDVRHVGSEISTGANLTLQSGGDQLYQVAKLESGKDLTLDSGGAITFEGVKDLHQESHEKSKSDLAWTSMSGKGNTDETLRQSQLIAKGELTIKAVNGLNIDIRQIDQQTVSQTIDAMVKADPQLAWLKEAEKRGDVDWRQVKELHDAYKYSHSSLGQGAMLAIIIIVTVLTAGAASGAVGTLAGTGAGSGSFMAAAGSTAMVQAGTAVGTAAAGLGNVMASAALTSMASTAAVSVVNNKGNLGATLKEVTSSDSLKGYLTSAAMAGFMPNYSPTALGLDLASAQTVLMKTTGDAFINTVINGGSYSDNLAQALVSQGNNIVMANGFKLVGDWAMGKYGDGSIQKVMAHAVMGGLLAEATGSDFKTGAIAAGANEALVNVLDSWVHGDQNLHGMASQLTGLLAAAAVNGDLNKGVEIAKYATTYNRQLHAEEQKWLEENAKTFAKDRGISEQTAMERLSQQALKDTDLFWRIFLSDGTDIDAQKFLAASGRTFTNDLGEQQALFTATGAQFIRMEMFADTVDPAFYKKFVSSGINRQLGEGLLTELKDLGIEVKDGTAALYEAVKLVAMMLPTTLL